MNHVLAAYAHPYSRIHMTDLEWLTYSILGRVIGIFTITMAVLALVRLRPARRRKSGIQSTVRDERDTSVGSRVG
jgi:hypothetical protein